MRLRRISDLEPDCLAELTESLAAITIGQAPDEGDASPPSSLTPGSATVGVLPPVSSIVTRTQLPHRLTTSSIPQGGGRSTYVSSRAGPTDEEIQERELFDGHQEGMSRECLAEAEMEWSTNHLCEVVEAARSLRASCRPVPQGHRTGRVPSVGDLGRGPQRPPGLIDAGIQGLGQILAPCWTLPRPSNSRTLGTTVSCSDATAWGEGHLFVISENFAPEAFSALSP
jgi:hypothetical protein